MTRKTKLYLAFTLILLLAGMNQSTLLAPAHAQGVFEKGFDAVELFRAEPVDGAGIRSFDSGTDFIILLLGSASVLLAAIALGVLLYGGFMYITSLGDEDRARTAKRVILYAIIGLLVIGAAGILTNAFINFITP